MQDIKRSRFARSKIGIFCLFNLFIFLVSVLPLFSYASSSPLAGFPAEFRVSELWQQLVIDGKPTRVYKFIADESLDEVKAKVSRWLLEPHGAALEQSKNGWNYFSQRKENAWVTVQMRLVQQAERKSVEGLVTIWQVAHQSNRRGLGPQLLSLENMQTLRRLESVDKGRNAVTISAISDSSIGLVTDSLMADMKRLGLMPASYAPPALLAHTRPRGVNAPVSQAWASKTLQIVFLVFEHRGKTAVQIYVLGGGHLE